MAHALFIILHFVAMGFYLPALFITIIGHIFYSLVSSRDKVVVAAGSTETVPINTTDHVKKCPYCAEEIKAEAKLCRFCGKDQVVPPMLRCSWCDSTDVYLDVYSKHFCPHCQKNVATKVE